MKIAIQNRRTLSIVPSASGIEVQDEAIYVIGDDSPWLFRFDSRFELTGRFQIAPIPEGSATTIPKKDKGDFEAITAVDWKGEPALAVFGSGSKSPERDVLVNISCVDPNRIQRYSLTSFYQQLKRTAGLGDHQLNIEAAVQHHGELLLFNRGVNLVIACNLEELIAHLDAGSDVPQLKIFPVNLPSIDGIEAGFSGAGLAAGSDDVVFTASVEKTSNWIDDGEVLGSFVGLIHIPSLQTNSTPDCVALTRGDRTLPVKVESVAVVSRPTAGRFELLLVTDSDGGVSEVIEATLDDQRSRFSSSGPAASD